MRRPAKILLVLFLLGLAGGWFLLARLDGMLRATLIEAASRAIGDRYTVGIGSVDARPFSGNISLREVYVLPRAGPAPADPGFALSVRASRVSLEGLSYRALLMDKELVVEAVRVIAPRVEYIYPPPSTVPDSTTRARTEPGADMPVSGAGRIGEIELRDASGVMRRTDRDSADLSIADLDILLRAVRRAAAEEAPLWQVASAEVDLHGVHAGWPPLYDIRVDSIALAYPACSARLSGARVIPRADRDHYAQLVHESIELLEVDLAHLAVHGVDLGALLHHRVVHVRKVEASGGHIYLDHDGHLPARPDRPRPLPRSGLAAMEAEVRVDSLDIALDGFRYGERGASAAGYGEILVARPRVRAAALRTRAPLDDPDTLTITVSGDLYGEGAVAVAFAAPYRSPEDAFSLRLDLGDMDFRAFSALTGDMLKASPVGGRIRSMNLRMEGDAARASGTFSMAYDGLRLDVLPEEGLKGRLISGLANMAVIAANPKSGAPMRRLILNVPRRKDRTIAAYVVGGLKEGVIRTLLPARIAQAALERAR